MSNNLNNNSYQSPDSHSNASPTSSPSLRITFLSGRLPESPRGPPQDFADRYLESVRARRLTCAQLRYFLFSSNDSFYRSVVPKARDCWSTLQYKANKLTWFDTNPENASLDFFEILLNPVFGDHPAQAIEQAIARGADLNQTDQHGRNILGYITTLIRFPRKMQRGWSGMSGLCRLAEYLIRLGVDHQHRDFDGRSALDHACFLYMTRPSADLSMVHLLLACQPGIDRRDTVNRLPRHYASRIVRDEADVPGWSEFLAETRRTRMALFPNWKTLAHNFHPRIDPDSASIILEMASPFKRKLQAGEETEICRLFLALRARVLPTQRSSGTRH